MKGNKLLEVIRNRLRHATFRLRTLPEPPEGLTGALLVAATASFLSLGIVLRAGSAVPSGPAREGAFGAVMVVGVVAYNFTFLLASVLVAWTAWSTRARNGILAVLVAVVLVLTLAPLPASASVLRSIGLAGIAVYLVAGILSSSPRFAAASAWQKPPRRLTVPVLLGSTLAIYLALAVADALAAASVAGTVQLSGVAELGGIVAACAAPFGLGCRWDRRALLLASVATSAFLIAALRTPLVPLIAMWTTSFSLHLPLPLYAVGLAAIVYTLFERVRAEGARGAAAGLWLLVLAGIGLKSTYEVLLVLTGLLVMFTRPPFLHRQSVAARPTSRPAVLAQEGGS
jgi:hypothetical protein